MRRAGVAHSGQGTLVWVDCMARVICAAASSTSHASRRSVVASGNKRAKMSGGCRVMKAGSSSRQRCVGETSMDTEGRTTRCQNIFQSGISPKVGKNQSYSTNDKGLCDFTHIVAGFLKHNMPTKGRHSSLPRPQAVKALNHIMAASWLCAA